eukprot:5031923-Prymnesium_polylepis.1
MAERTRAMLNEKRKRLAQTTGKLRNAEPGKHKDSVRCSGCKNGNVHLATSAFGNTLCRKCNATRHGEFFNREYAESPFLPRREFKEIEHRICRTVGFWQFRH